MNKTLAVLCVAGAAVAAGCASYDPYPATAYQSGDGRYYNSSTYDPNYPYNRTRYYNSDGTFYYRDSDRDGVPNSQDSRPYNPTRY